MRKCLSLLFAGFFFLMLSACTNGGAHVPVDNAWGNVDTTQSRHRVQSGETIYSIAWRYGLDYQQIVRWNHLEKPYHLRIGQVLLVAPPKNGINQTAVAPAVTSGKIETVPSFTPVSTEANAATTATAATATAPKALSASNNAQTKTGSEPEDIEMLQGNESEAAVKSTSAAKVASNGKNWPWPVKGKVVAGYDDNGNKGIDIAAPAGSPVKAVQSGTVVYAGSNLRGYGQLVIIKHNDGNLLTAYAHNSRLLVKEGDTVKAGKTIAMSGDTEASQAMLHFEVRQNGKPVDPLPYLKN